MSFFESNLKLLRAASVQLADKMAEMHSRIGEPLEYNGFIVEKAKNGQLSAAYEAEGRRINIHSSYDPGREAEQFASAMMTGHNGGNFIVFMGFGLGHGVREMLWRLPDNYRVLVFEPHWELFYLAFCHTDLSYLFDRPNTTLSCDPNIQGAMFSYMNLFELASFTGVRFISNPVYDSLPHAGSFDELAARVRYEMLAVGGNTQTLMVMGEMQQMNVILNLPHVFDNPPFRHLIGRFGGKPAIIVSAGPSLEKNMHLLKEAASSSVIIAVDTAVKPLIANGITPHIVVSGDPQEANYRHLKGVDLPETYLIVEPQCPVSTLSEWTGPKFICTFHDNMMRWVDRVIGDRGHVLVWGSVAVMAYDIAVKLGADPIVFIGQDLSFPGGRTYASGTFFETEEKQEMTTESLQKSGTALIEMEDIYGETVSTNRQMYAYFNFLKNRFQDNEVRGRKIINATEGGILKSDRVTVMPLREVMDSFMTESLPVLQILGQAHSEENPINYTNLLCELDILLSSLREGHGQCERGLAAVRATLELLAAADGSKGWRRDVARSYNRLGKFRKGVGTSEEATKLIEMANQSGIFAFAQGLKQLQPMSEEAIDEAFIKSACYHHHTLFVSTRDAIERMLPLIERVRREAEKRGDRARDSRRAPALSQAGA